MGKIEVGNPATSACMGSASFVFREEAEEEAYPLNILDTQNMLIEWDGDCLLKVVTHREVCSNKRSSQLVLVSLRKQWKRPSSGIIICVP